MSADPTRTNPQIEQAGATDESIQRVHSVLLREKVEPAEGFAPMPLFLLGFISTMIFLVAIYLVHYRGGFDSMVYDERFDPVKMGKGAVKAAVDPVVAGKRHYATACLACHQANGLGLPPAFPPLVESDWVLGSEERVIRILLHGLEGPVEVNGTTYNGIMPAFGVGSAYNWNDQRISEVLTYIRAEWGNTAAPITAEQVTAIRTGAAAGRAKAWTAEELLTLP